MAQQLLWDVLWQVRERLDAEVPKDPGVPPLGAQQREGKAYGHGFAVTRLFVPVRLRDGRKGERAQGLPAGEGVDGAWTC